MASIASSRDAASAARKGSSKSPDSPTSRRKMSITAQPANSSLTARRTVKDTFKCASDLKACQHCPLLEKCIENNTNRRIITRHLDESFLEVVNAKGLHELRFTFYRGQEAVSTHQLGGSYRSKHEEAVQFVNPERPYIYHFFNLVLGRASQAHRT